MIGLKDKCRLFRFAFVALVIAYLIFAAMFVVATMLSGDILRGLFLLLIMSIPFFLMRISQYAALFFLVVPFLIMSSLIAYLQVILVMNGGTTGLFMLSMAGVALLFGLWFAYILKEVSCTYGRYVIGAVYHISLQFLLMLSVLMTIKSVILGSSPEQAELLSLLPGPIYLGLLLFMAPYVWFAACRSKASCSGAESKRKR